VLIDGTTGKRISEKDHVMGPGPAATEPILQRFARAASVASK